MKALVDTQVFLWAIADDKRLSPKLRKFYLDEANDLYLSVVCQWEMLIKCGLGKLKLPLPASKYIEKQMERNRLSSLSIQAAHLDALETLPPVHRDPFDRMLVAQSIAEGWPILTADRELKKYPIRVL